MLGARARAAEYNAFKAATARQAQREAHEQLFPPKPMPIALSAFSRSVTANRNRGNKTWRPLILDDFPDDDGSLPPSMEDSPPGNSTSLMILKNAMGSNGMDCVNDGYQHKADTPTIRLPQMAVQAQCWSPADNLLFAEPVPYRPIYPYFSTARYTPASSAQINNVGPGDIRIMKMSAADDSNKPSILSPCDISPSKQEQKLALLAEANKHLTRHDTQVQVDDAAAGNLDEQAHGKSDLPCSMRDTDEISIWGREHVTLTDDLTTTWSFILQHTQSEPTLSQPNTVLTPSLTPLRSRQRSYDESPSVGRLARQARKAAAEKSAKCELNIIREKVESYDRKSKMQKFMATQQALAKIGKTVLHNPELHKRLIEGGQEKEEAEEEVDARSGSIEEENTVTVSTGSKGTSTFSTSSSRAINFCKIDQRARDDMLRAEFGVGTVKWFEIAPINLVERQQMLQVMKRGI